MAYTTIDDPTLYFQTVLYAGNGSADHAITLPGDTDMQPDTVWIKNRDATDAHCLFDSVRGATKLLTPDHERVEATDTDTLDAFQSDGFALGNNTDVNGNTEKFVAWCWKAGTTSGITTDGSTTITPSAYSFNATSGHSIISFDGNATAGAGLPHGLGKKPHFAILKRRGTDNGWWVYLEGNTSAPETDYQVLDHALATVDAATAWNDTAPSTTNLFLGTADHVNAADAHMAWIWTSIQGYSKVGGSYVGNGNADGPFIFTGFRPAWLMIKNVTETQGWEMWDNKRSPSNSGGKILAANTTTAERSNETWAALDFLSNGFKIRYNDALNNNSGITYSYIAFAEAPFVNSNGVPCNAR